jgi:DNA processing protein
MAEQNLHDWLALTFLPGIGCTLANRMLVAFGSPANILSSRPDELQRIPGVGPELAGRIAGEPAQSAARRAADRELRALDRTKVDLVPLSDPRYPFLLRNIPDPPLLLYCRGNTGCLDHPAVAMVGSRSATNYGRRISFTLGRELAEHGICVVSGMALGIDGGAHAGALAGGGRTIGVLGCGIDVVYPRQNRSLFGEVAERGLLVSEYPLGSQPEAYRFPERNRIISGLALGVVVVEATLKSGSLITAGQALDQNREVFAVPGRIDSAKSRGTHRLVQQGAKLVHGVDDILEEFHLPPAGGQRQGQAGEVREGQQAISDEELRLLSCLDTYPVNIDELVRLSGFDPAALADLLVRLELRGAVRQLPGQQYELCR